MGKMHTDDSFMYEGLPIGDAMQKAWENQMLDDYETPADISSVETDPLVNRITYQRGPKAPSTASQEKALEELVRNAEELDLYDDKIVHDLTKPLSQQIGGSASTDTSTDRIKADGPHCLALACCVHSHAYLGAVDRVHRL